MNKSLVLMLALIFSALVAVSGFLFFQNQKLKESQKQVSSTATAEPDPSPSPAPESPSPSPKLTLKEVQENIAAAINSKNFGALETFMTNLVLVILQATECCGTQTPAQAIAQMSYINDGLPFDFDQNSETIKNLKNKNPELANSYIGISKTTEYLIAFEINPQNKISSIRMSVSWKLFSY